LTTTNPVKKKLKEGKVSLGSWIQIGHPAVAEVLSRAGFDWIAADMEHTDIGIEGFTDIARGMYGRGPIPLARVRENDTLAIRQVLDNGGWGVVVPLVNSAAEAEKAVRAVKFPPRGIRGTAFFRANDYGADFADYMKHANDESLVIVMIESKEAVEAIDEIVGVDGVDGVFIGPYDLSLSYGIPGRVTDPLMVDAKKKVILGCRKAGKAAGIHEVRLSEEGLAAVVADGFTFIGLSMDTLFLENGAREALNKARAAIDRVAGGGKK
jgi:2-keto-3-deoxy-L-rhamnonate aldolase RhmA